MSDEAGRGRVFYGWYVALAGFVTLAFGAGIWTGFGVFFPPLLAEFSATRGGLSLVVSVGMLSWALSQLFIGTLLNRFGPRRMIVSGVALMGLGSLLSSMVSSAGGLFGTYGLLVAVGSALATMNSVSVLVSRWFVRKRGTALGLTIAGFNAGQFLLIPLSQALIGAFGWRWAFVLWAGLFWVFLAPVAWAVVRDSPAQMGLFPDGAATPGPGETEPLVTRIAWIPRGQARDALGTRPFWLLFASYFACGFTDFTIYVHLPIFAAGIGLGGQAAAGAVGMIGGLSIIGVVSMGALADRIGFRVPLAVIYAMRCAGMLLLGFAGSPGMLFAAVAVYGLFHLASTPLTPGMAAHLYGTGPLATLYGYLLFGHSLGALLGPYVAGAAFDWWGRYDPAFFLTAFILAGASVCCAVLKTRGDQGCG
ncbi:MAG: MFS transporter [Candidatus Tectomicrobia bacterium]|nr:MFS transporter [Candidatus Tectomicrobia bacterium]